MKKYILILLSLLTMLINYSNANDTSSEHIKIWPEGKMPYAKEKVDFEERYDAQSGFVFSIVEPELYYYPAEKPVTDAAVIICPGGGYEFVSIDGKGHMTARWFNEQGITAFVLKYRIKQYGQPAPLADAQRAMRYVRMNAEKYKVNPDRLGIVGSSAGGHVAACCSTMYDRKVYELEDDKDISARPAFSILVFPVISMGEETNQWSKDNLLGKNPTQELIEEFSCERFVNDKTPPAYIVHCTDDHVVPVSNAIRYYQQLIANNVDAEMHIYNKGGHGFTVEGKPGTLASWSDTMKYWLKAQGILTPKE